MGAMHITFSQAHQAYKHPYSLHTISQVEFIAQIIFRQVHVRSNPCNYLVSA